jgi:three-Cys-motif partner protein
MNSQRSEYRRDLYRDREQSYVKHVILRAYLERFAHIIGSWADSITYVDCFSGPWQTKSEEFRDTSFGIAIDELRKARQHIVETMGKQVALRCFFVESDKKSFERLDAFRKGNSDIEIRLAHSKFEAALPQIQSFIQEPRGKKFAFILMDPKGWDGFSMSAMAELLRLPYVEVVVNFMTSFIKRFLESPKELTQIQLEALFGDGSFRKVIEGLSGLEREYAAVDAYAKNLAKVGDFGFVCKALVLNPEIDKTHYHLVYATRNLKGAEVFKKAESKAMKEMNLARAEVSQRKREEKTGQKDLFDATSLQPSGHYDELREFFTKKARADVWKLVFSRCEVLYEALWERAMQFPVVWDSDLKDWLAEWKEAGKIELPDLKPRERVPKLRAGHRIVRKLA